MPPLGGRTTTVRAPLPLGYLPRVRRTYSVLVTPFGCSVSISGLRAAAVLPHATAEAVLPHATAVEPLAAAVAQRVLRSSNGAAPGRPVLRDSLGREV